MSPPRVSIVVPTYNRADVVETTLARLVAQAYPADRLEVLVADNSSDATPDVVRAAAARAPFPVRLLASAERLPAVKRNQALRAAVGDLVLFMNDDVWVRTDFVAEHVAAHARRPGPVAVLGLVEQSAAMPRDPFTDWYRPFAYHELAGREGCHVGWRYHWSMNLSLPRAVMLARNLVFHEDWAEIGHEDVELGYRWTRAGYPVVYHPAAWGEHYHPHDLDSACRLQVAIGRGLRDLEALVPEPGLLAGYGVPDRRAPRRTRLRLLARRALFNRLTVPPLQRRLARLDRRRPLAEWSYWKVMLHHTARGYREAPRRAPRPVPTTTGAAS
jgi:glycosyltransferase involved in cell wall biosynthesis